MFWRISLSLSAYVFLFLRKISIIYLVFKQLLYTIRPFPDRSKAEKKFTKEIETLTPYNMPPLLKHFYGQLFVDNDIYNLVHANLWWQRRNCFGSVKNCIDTKTTRFSPWTWNITAFQQFYTLNWNILFWFQIKRVLSNQIWLSFMSFGAYANLKSR